MYRKYVNSQRPSLILVQNDVKLHNYRSISNIYRSNNRKIKNYYVKHVVSHVSIRYVLFVGEENLIV